MTKSTYNHVFIIVIVIFLLVFGKAAVQKHCIYRKAGNYCHLS